jgi:hypothetical protein
MVPLLILRYKRWVLLLQRGESEPLIYYSTGGYASNYWYTSKIPRIVE